MPQDQDPQITLEDFEENRRKHYGLPKGLTESLRTQESGGRQYDKSGAVLTSPKQAKGRYQVLQSTADRYGLNVEDPFENIEAGFRYLSDLHKQVDKNVTDPGERWAQTLAGYHAGDGRLREVNKTGNLPSTSDGLIRTDEYVRNIMNRWQRHDQGQSGQQPAQAEQARFDLNSPKAVAPKTQKPIFVSDPGSGKFMPDPGEIADPLGYTQEAQPRSYELLGMIESFERAKLLGDKRTARIMADDIRRGYGKWIEVGEGGGWPYVKPKRPKEFDYDLNKVLEAAAIDPSNEARQRELEQKRAEFSRKPVLDQWIERGTEALGRGGGHLSKMARQTIQAGKSLDKKIGTPIPIFSGAGALIPQSAMESWRQGDERTMRMLEERRQGRPSSLTSDVVEGVIEGVPAAAAAIGGGILTGGGLPAAMAIGGGMGAAGADWNDPRRALAQTALNAVAPVAGGKLGAKVGGAVASRLSRPVAQGAARAGGELVGGAAGNVLGSGVEQLAFEGQLDPRELTKQAITGAALNIPGAAQVARRGAPTVPMGTRPGVTPELNPQEIIDLNIRRAIDSYTQTVDAINRSQAPPTTKAAQIEQARQAYLAERQAASGAPAIQRQPSAVQFQPWPRTPQGAIISPESPVGNRLLLPPAPSAPDTRPIPQPDAPITQESPAFRQWMGVENALTTDIPAPPAGLPRTTPRLLPAEPTGEGPLRRTAELPETGLEVPQAQQSQRLSSGDRPLVETSRRTAEIRMPEAGLEPQIDQPLNLKRAGNEPTNRITEGEGAELPRYTPRPLEGQPTEIPRRLPSGLLQTSTPGRKATQEVQIPPSRNPRTDFNSREDARQGHFEQFNDQELVQEIGRLTEEKNKGIRGKSKLSPEELQANNFDLRIATEMQKERRRLQRMMGRDETDMIAPRTPGRKVQHSQFGEVTEAPDQKGVPRGQLRVVDGEGAAHVIKNPRTKGGGNRNAAFVRPEPRYEIPAEAVPEMRGAPPPRPITPRQGARTGAIPTEAMPEIRSRPGTIMGAGLGGLQPLFERGGKQQSKAPKLFDDTPSDGLTTRERIGRKVATAQTIAQLLNPKTISQNIIGNAAFAGGKNLANVVALPVDKILSAFTGQRQVATPQLKAQISDFKKGFAEVYHAVKSDDYAKLSENNRYELNDQRAFKGKVGGFFEDVMSVALRAPDRGAYLAAYNDSVQQIVAANKKSKKPYSLDRIHEQAQIEAQQATFQDENLISNFATKLRDGLNTVTPFGKKSNFGLGDLVGLKYVKTPANLLARGVEYSPLGFVNAFAKMGNVLAGKGKGFDQRDASLAFGKAFVGSAFGSGLGAALHAMGIITQPEQQDRSVQAAERAEGLNGYQVNLSALKRYATGGLLDALTGDLNAGKKQAGDVMMSYDWLQPWAFSLGMGAAAAKAFEKRKADADTLEDILTQIDAVTSTLTDQSVLRNIRDAFKKGIKETGRKILTDTPASFVPSALNLVRQIVDDRAREVSKEKGAEGIKREALEKVLNRLPGASKGLPEKKDPVGRSIPSRMSGATGAALTSVPGRFTQYDPHPVLSEMAATGAGTSSVQRKDGESEGQFKARRERAAGWRNRYGLQLTASQAYKSASPEQRKAAIDYLEGQISAQSDEKRPKLYLFRPVQIFQAVREKEREKRRKAKM